MAGILRSAVKDEGIRRAGTKSGPILRESPDNSYDPSIQGTADRILLPGHCQTCRNCQTGRPCPFRTTTEPLLLRFDNSAHFRINMRPLLPLYNICTMRPKDIQRQVQGSALEGLRGVLCCRDVQIWSRNKYSCKVSVDFLAACRLPHTPRCATTKE